VRKKRKWGRGLSGWYKGFWLDSSWELAFLMFNLDNGIPIARNEVGFLYKYGKKELRYYPDFIVDGKYVEIKGKMDRKSKSKIRQFPHELLVIGPLEIKMYLGYAKKKYGDRFSRLMKNDLPPPTYDYSASPSVTK
jgi:hypothetical protein